MLSCAVSSRHQRDVVSVTASARWRGGSTPSTRRCCRHCGSSMQIFSLVDFHTGRRWRKIRRDKERSLERKAAKQARREARWKQALEEQVKPEYRFGLDAAEDEPDEDNSWQDWTWDKPLGAKFSAGAEYLSFRTGRSWDRL